MLRALGRTMANGVNSGEMLFLKRGWGEMNEAVKRYWRHEVDEKAVQHQRRGPQKAEITYLVILSKE